MTNFDAEVFPHPFNAPYQGTVDSNGDCIVAFGPPHNQTWTVEQVVLEMTTAPSGASAELRYMSSLVAPASSPRKATASENPPLFLQGGETASVVWRNCTPGDIGRVLVIYRKGSYY